MHMKSLDLCLLRKTKSQVCASFAWICELRRDFSRIRLFMHTFENMSKLLILCATAQDFVICGCTTNFIRNFFPSSEIGITTTDYELMYISRKDEWFWHVFEGMHHKTNSWKVPLQFANSRKTCANLRFCFAQKTQVHCIDKLKLVDTLIIPCNCTVIYRVITVIR